MKQRILKRKQILTRFLKEYNCYKQFCNSLNHYQKKNEKYILKKGIEELIFNVLTLRSRSEIFNSFDWIGTKEGYDFWESVNEKWMKLNYKLK